MKKGLKFFIAAMVTLLIAGIGYYFLLPALNVYSEEFWVLLAVLAVSAVISSSYTTYIYGNF